MLLTILANLVMEPVVPPTPTDTDGGYLPPRTRNHDEELRLEQEKKIKKQNEEIFIIVNSIMTCLN